MNREKDTMKTTRHRSFLLATLTLLAITPIFARNPARRGVHHSGRASYHERTAAMVTAAHGVHRGARLWIWRPGKNPKSGFTVTCNDAGPYVSGRVLDLSTGAYKRLYGSLKSGHAPIRYKVLKDGKGAWTGSRR